MSYRTTEHINLPFKLFPTVNEVGSSRVDYKISIKPQFSEMHLATGVLLKIPVPPNTATTKINTSKGKAKYVAQENAIIWKLGMVVGGKDHHISCEVGLMATIKKKTWSRPPISM